VQTPVDAPDRGNAIRCRSQLRNHLGIVRRPALQRQQAYDHLQAVQQPMIGLLPQHRLLLDQRVLLTKQSLFPGESLAKPAFRAPVPYQLAFVARDRAALAAFENDILVIRSFPRLFDAHFVASLWVQVVPWTPGQKSIFGRGWPSHIDPNQTCPIPDSLPLRSFAIPRVFYSAIKPMNGKPPSIPAATNFVLTGKNSYVSPKSVSPGLCRGRRTPIAGL